jgi:hypothetical protein
MADPRELRYPTDRYQLVWWRDPRDWYFGHIGPFPYDGPNRGAIFRWRFAVGPLEIRRWTELENQRVQQ